MHQIFDMSIFYMSYQQNFNVIIKMYEKEHSRKDYHGNTRQFSKNVLRDQRWEYPNKISEKMKAQRHHQLFQHEKNDSTDNYNRAGISQYSDKYNMANRNLSSYHLESHQRHKISHQAESHEEFKNALNGKRQNVKLKQLELKANNINTINDKINGLLNLVKKDKKQTPFNENQCQPSQKNPSFNNSKLKNHRQQDQGKRKSDEDYSCSKRHNKSIQRLRALSTLEPNLANCKRLEERTKNHTIFQDNSQKNHIKNKSIDNKKYSPTKNNVKSRSKSQQKLTKNQKSQQKVNQQIYGQHANDRKNQNHQFQRSSSQNTPQKKTPTKDLTPIKHEKIVYQKKEIFESSKRPKNQLESPCSRNYEYQNFVPVSLIQDQSQSFQSLFNKQAQKYSEIKTVDDQIRRIKQKTGDVQSSKQKYLSPTREFLRSIFQSKENRQSPVYSSKKFQINVYPVQNNRPETIKIAERLSNQIQTDNRMKKVKDFFLKMEGQQKWKDLNYKLLQSGLRLTVNELKMFLSQTPESIPQTCPQDKVYNQHLKDLAEKFMNAQKFWEKNVAGCASLKSLRKQGFDAKELDEGQKGYLSIEDFVNFVNNYTLHSYGKNDLLMIFKRLQIFEGSNNLQKIEYSTFMQAFTM